MSMGLPTLRTYVVHLQALGFQLVLGGVCAAVLLQYRWVDVGVFVNTPTIWRSLRESQTPCLPAPWRCARQGHLACSTRPIYWKRYPIPLHCLAYNIWLSVL